MPVPDDLEHFDLAAYERASNDFVVLQAHLPREAIVNLASEVVTRLSRDMDKRLCPDTRPSDAEIEQLCDALLSPEPEAAAELVAGLRARGVAVADLYQAYLGGAARCLGARWETNMASFTDVTIGASRIYAILRTLRDELAHGTIRHMRSLAFASVPGEQHTLGVSMAADLFRGDGWDVELLVGLSHEGLLERLESADFALTGLSASRGTSFSSLARLIVSLRVCNPSMSILISGTIVEDARDIIPLTGADGMCWDLDSARREVERLTAPRLGER